MEELIIVAFCLGLNALLACFEMAFVTVTIPRLRLMAKKGVSSANKILLLRENPERTLSVLQIGITLVGMVSAAVGGAGAEESFAPIIEKQLGFSENVAEAIAIAMVVVPLTYFSVVLGELVPKTIALRSPLTVALTGAKWVMIADRIFAPIVWLLEKTTKLVLLPFPKKTGSQEDVPSAGSVDIEHLSSRTQQYVLNLVGVEGKRAEEHMVPWEDVAFINLSSTKEQVASAVIRFAHTRLPVLDGERVVGVLHTKEFGALQASTSEDWHAIIRPPLVISGTERMLRALRKMQSKRNHLSVIVDDKNKPLGILTMEDVLEEIVGEIYDEDEDGRVWRLLSTDPKIRSIVRFSKTDPPTR